MVLVVAGVRFRDQLRGPLQIALIALSPRSPFSDGFCVVIDIRLPPPESWCSLAVFSSKGRDPRRLALSNRSSTTVDIM